VAAACTRWNCTIDGTPTHGQVAVVVPVQHRRGPAVLKISFPHPSNLGEAAALRTSSTLGVRTCCTVGGMCVLVSSRPCEADRRVVAASTMRSAVRVRSSRSRSGRAIGCLIRGDDIHILTGAHGLPNGSMLADASMYADDVARFGDLPGVTIHDVASMSPEAISGLLQRPGTIIGGLCDSTACLGAFR
jgi:hypothetical protein